MLFAYVNPKLTGQSIVKNPNMYLLSMWYDFFFFFIYFWKQNTLCSFFTDTYHLPHAVKF